jgi:L-amino acid N-acyltransferase YncA
VTLRARRFEIGPLTQADWPAVARIFEAGIAGGDATFEREAPGSWREWSDARLQQPKLAARDRGGEVIGWAALSATSARPVYRGVAEIGIYVAPGHMGKGVGRALLGALIDASERGGIWTLQAGIFPENRASIAVHERCGFELVGVRRRIGQMPDGRWRDVLLFERRSGIVGQDALGNTRIGA